MVAQGEVHSKRNPRRRGAAPGKISKCSSRFNATLTRETLESLYDLDFEVAASGDQLAMANGTVWKCSQDRDGDE